MKYDLKQRKQTVQAQEETVPDTVPEELKSSYENIWGQNSRKVMSIEIGRIVPYRNSKGGQPYRMNEKKISQIAASAADIGIITPLQVREIDGGNYEIISGHHRYEAAKQIGLLKVPCVIVRNMSDEQAFQVVSESNIQRSRILPSEYGKMFSVYMSRKKDNGMTSDDIFNKFGVSSKTMYRYINIAKMNENIQALFDNRRINTCAIDNIADFTEDAQNALYKALTDTEVILSVEVSKRLKETAEALAEDGIDVTAEDFAEILTGRDKVKASPKYSNKIYENINRKHHLDISEEELDKITSKLLDEYFNNLKKDVALQGQDVI